MASITVGGTPYSVAPLNFFQIETAWPCYLAAQAESEPIAATGHYISFVAAILADAYPQFAEPIALKKALLVKEIANVGVAVREILVENEMIKPASETTDEDTPGEDQPAGTPGPVDSSTETAPGSFVS